MNDVRYSLWKFWYTRVLWDDYILSKFGSNLSFLRKDVTFHSSYLIILPKLHHMCLVLETHFLFFFLRHVATHPKPIERWCQLFWFFLPKIGIHSMAWWLQKSKYLSMYSQWDWKCVLDKRFLFFWKSLFLTFFYCFFNN